MPFTAIAAAGVGAAGAIGSSLISAKAAKGAATQQAATQQAALQQQKDLFQQGVGLVQPFIDFGKTAGGTLTDFLSPGSTLAKLLTPGPNQTATLSQLPGFQFAQDWGQKAVANLGSTLGFGGNTLKAGADYATGTAQQGFGTLVGLLQNYGGMLQNLTQTGAGAAGAAFGNATQTGANMANTFTNLGNAQAAGTLGSANALAGGIGGVGNSVTNALLLNKLFGGGAGANANSGIYSANTLSTLNATSPGDI